MKVRCTGTLISQCWWWARAITLALILSPIPDQYMWEPMVTVGLYLDAAGGSNMKVCRGMGVVLEMHGICHLAFALR